MTTMEKGLIHRVAVNLRDKTRHTGWGLRQISPVLLSSCLMDWISGCWVDMVSVWTAKAMLAGGMINQLIWVLTLFLSTSGGQV